jgi:putative transposase
LTKEIKLCRALKFLDLEKSTYFYKEKILDTKKPKKEYVFDEELKNILLNLNNRELSLGYFKLTSYLTRKHEKIWNHKKVYRHMKELKLLKNRQIKRRFLKHKKLGVYCASSSNEHWEADMTYVWTNLGNMYLFVIEDTFDKEIVGEHFDVKASVKESIEALKLALENRFCGAVPSNLKLKIRVDRGCQYTAEAFEKFATENNIELEFCGVQTPNDKPYVESFFSSYKCEEVYRNRYENFYEALDGWKGYIDWYNNLRPHGALNNLSPKEFKKLQNNEKNSTLFG